MIMIINLVQSTYIDHFIQQKQQNTHYFVIHIRHLPKLTICWVIKYLNELQRIEIIKGMF